MILRVFGFWLLLLSTALAQPPQPLGTQTVNLTVTIGSTNKEEKQ